MTSHCHIRNYFLIHYSIISWKLQIYNSEVIKNRIFLIMQYNDGLGMDKKIKTFVCSWYINTMTHNKLMFIVCVDENMRHIIHN